MAMEREYFTIKLTAEIDLGVALADMTTAVQFETKNICVVPGVAEFWYGVVNYQGGLLWVLDSDRFFECSDNGEPFQKLTAIIVRDRVAGDRKRVAIVTPQLKGIVAVEPTNLSSLADNRTSRLHQCCSAVVQTAVKAIYLIDPAALLQEIHQESSILT